MAKRTERIKTVAEAQAVKVVGYDLDYSDDEIDEWIEFLVRIFERSMTNPRFMRLVTLGKLFQ